MELRPVFRLFFALVKQGDGEHQGHEAAETYDLIHALKLLGEVEEQSADKRKKMEEEEEEEGKRLAESVRSAEERHAFQIARINELYEAGAISAETRARGITQANEELANSGKNAFGELKSAVEGWGLSSARYMAEAFTSGRRCIGGSG